MNRYAYVQNNPLSFLDPSGLCEDVAVTMTNLDGSPIGDGTETKKSGGIYGTACCPPGTGFSEVNGWTVCGPPSALGYLQGQVLLKIGCTQANCGNNSSGSTAGAPINGPVPVHGLWTYGNHCGAGGMGADVNGTDAACHVHDDCFDAIHLTADQYTSGNLTPTQVQGAAACNQQLCNSALNVNRDPSVPFSQRWAGAEIILFFSLTGPKGAQCHGF
jgi:hypothetical protein